MKSATETSERFDKENRRCRENSAKKDYICEKCNKTGHNAKTCKN